MIIDFVQMQKQKFEESTQRIMTEPLKYVLFDSVSDFYKAEWLNEFPKGTTWTVTGLDDGADEFYIQLQYKELLLSIDIQVASILLKFRGKTIKVDK